ncbi:MAG: metalloregulator ArsR/SmtB family transcription factor [Pseudomonadota bacterium]
MISVDLVFSALSDPTRRTLLATLAQEGNASASGLAHTNNISRQAIAKHLGILENAGLVTRHKQGKEIVFEAEPSQLAAAGRWLQRTADRWQGQH